MTLVLLTPVGLDRDCWAWLDLPAVPTHRHEFPGFGGRPRAQRTPDMAMLADEVAASYDGQLDVVGVSMGGMVAQHVALRHPRRVRSVLVACTGASVDPEVMGGRAARVREEGMAGVLQETLARWFTPGALAADPVHPGVAYATETLRALSPEAFADGWLAIAGHDALPRLERLRARVTCLAGAQDVSAPIARVREIVDGVPDGRLVVLDGPHMIHLQQPDAFSRALAEHLDRGGEDG